MNKRFNLNIPAELFDEVQQEADIRGTTPTEMFRLFTKLGLLVAKIERDPNSDFILRDGQQERVVILLM